MHTAVTSVVASTSSLKPGQNIVVVQRSSNCRSTLVPEDWWRHPRMYNCVMSFVADILHSFKANRRRLSSFSNKQCKTNNDE